MLERFIQLGSLPLLVAALLVAGFGVPIPEDVVLIAGGVLAHRTAQLPGSAAWESVLVALYVGAIGADCILFAVVRRYGEGLLGRAPFRWLLTSDRRARVRRLFSEYGARALFVGRHLGGVRAVVFAMAALEGVPFRVFLFWDGLAGLFTVPFVFGLGYLFSSHVSTVAEGLARAEHWVLCALGVGSLLSWFFWRRRRSR
jgi:membrane protein DedA with SNARE-associated domain